MIEDLKNIAIVLGLISFLFTAYDRFIGGRPLLSLIVPEILGSRRPYIRVKNVGKHDVLLRKVWIKPREVFWIAKSDEVKDIIDGAFGWNRYIILAPDEEVCMLLIARESNLEIFENRKSRLLIAINWRRTRSAWLPQIPAFMVVPALELKSMVGESIFYRRETDQRADPQSFQS